MDVMKGGKGLGFLNMLLCGLQILLSGVSLLGVVIVLDSYMDQPLFSIGLALGMMPAAIILHESGHYFGARFNCMTVLSMRVMAVEIQFLRRGFKLRWSPQSKGRKLGGYLMVAGNLKRPLRRQMLWMVMMGPVLNLVMSLACIGLWWFTHGLASALAMGFSLVNLGMGLTNLLPTLRGHASDGMVFIVWWLHQNDDRPELAQTRLLALSVAGTPSEQLPEADIVNLSQGSMPGPLIALDYRLTALLNRGQWQAAVLLERELELLLQAQPKIGMDTLIRLLRIELSFARAYLQRDVTGLWSDWMNQDINWYAPWLRPRCEALRSILLGDLQQAETHLQRALLEAKGCKIASQQHSETILAQHLRALASKSAFS
ncbi:M50 family metallopeptidase [Pseudomonas sp. S9]|uniref:M50 family metallopeptidase n=1 Tax=Pseudomonas sp. S9 TaxID=686578 RepID=UPI000684F72D|nr:M50 family metallopeptidase [Pseudomonas sp. S9]